MSAATATRELSAALDSVLGAAGLGPVAVVCRRPSAYRSGFPLEEIEIGLESGERLRLACKEISWRGLDAGARLAKPRFLHDPRREAAVYASVLGAGEPGPPRYYGSVEAGGRCLLFVEWVRGRELYQVGERGLWEGAATWLGRTHARLASELERYAAAGRLIEHDPAFHRRWMRRAVEFSHGRPAAEAAAIEWLARRHERVVEALASLPQTVLHGDFNASNVLVGEGPVPRVAAVDWELAARGAGLTDLASLVSGGWRAEDREALAAAYCLGRGERLDDSVRRGLGVARLQLAIQWLGWAPPEWVPPPAQRQDWLATAVELAEELEL